MQHWLIGVKLSVSSAKSSLVYAMTTCIDPLCYIGRTLMRGQHRHQTLIFKLRIQSCYILAKQFKRQLPTTLLMWSKEPYPRPLKKAHESKNSCKRQRSVQFTRLSFNETTYPPSWWPSSISKLSNPRIFWLQGSLWSWMNWRKTLKVIFTPQQSCYGWFFTKPTSKQRH